MAVYRVLLVVGLLCSTAAQAEDLGTWGAWKVRLDTDARGNSCSLDEVTTVTTELAVSFMISAKMPSDISLDLIRLEGLLGKPNETGLDVTFTYNGGLTHRPNFQILDDGHLAAALLYIKDFRSIVTRIGSGDLTSWTIDMQGDPRVVGKVVKLNGFIEAAAAFASCATNIGADISNRD